MFKRKQQTQFEITEHPDVVGGRSTRCGRQYAEAYCIGIMDVVERLES